METDEVVKSEGKETQQTSTSSTPVPAPATAPPATTTTSTAPVTKTKLPSIVLPEVDLYLSLLVLLFAIDRKKYKQVFENFIVEFLNIKF